MAKLIAPLLALSARGTIADTITYSAWKGIEFARQRVIPANPQTAEQSLTRDVFKCLGQLWVKMKTLARAPWIANAVGKPYTHRNSLLRSNLGAMREAADMQDFTGSPGSLAGLPPATIAAVYNAPNIEVTIGAPTLPPDWLIEAGVAVAFKDQDPHDDFASEVNEASDATSPYVALITAAPLTGLCVVSGWFRYTRPDSRTAYGPSLSTTVTIV